MKLKVLSLCLLLTFAAACKSNSKKDLKPQPDQAPETAAPIVAAPRPAQEAPTKPFSNLPTDVEELNRLARANGWIQDAFFTYDSNVLSDEARNALSTSARWLKEHPEVELTIEGHADERGTEQYNLALGERRAWAARDYLLALGIDGNRMGSMSLGEERPFATGANESAWSQNRRAHLSLRLVQ